MPRKKATTTEEVLKQQTFEYTDTLQEDETQIEQPIKLDKKEPTFEFKIGSNIVFVNGIKKYLHKIVWSDVTYNDIKEFICK